MAKSKFEYVRHFEEEKKCLKDCWIVVRIDGKSFHKFTKLHDYIKPNDDRGLNLMTKSALSVMENIKDICLAYGQSDEYSFIFQRNTQLYNRRESKIMTYVCSLFSSSFVYYWNNFFEYPLKSIPSFDAKIILYPTNKKLRDYMSWRQADCHINNLYNTAFWALIQEGGLSPRDSEQRLCKTVSSDKNEILFTEFNINYNELPQLYRKGTVIISTKEKSEIEKEPKVILSVQHVDIIGDQFWKEHPILDKYPD
ncbi:THG1L [Cordylochernes scorpioides]|uniref:tRNA(His) guanylyltransferase n=1 Tax=Cordylochernes scorpioides TaxID=51811 RepID=A0ABY6LL70_9ARAC|nr:THG1L [Cordylochernes scorpioides]